MSPQPTILRYGDVARHLERLAEDGYTVLPGLVDAEAVRRLRDEVMTIIAETQPPFGELQQSSQYLRGSHLNVYVNSAALLGLAEALLQGPSWRFLPFTAVKGPGGGAFQYHQDNQFREFDGPGVNLWLALDDVDEANGAILVVPGSHRLGPLPWAPTGHANRSRKITWEPDGVAVPMQRGDCLVFDRLTIHASCTNVTDRHRVAYSVTFHRDDVSFHEDGKWWLLRTHSRWRTMPVDSFRSFSDSAPGPHR